VALRSSGALQVEILDLAVQIALGNLRGFQAGFREAGRPATADDGTALESLEDAEPLARGADFTGGSVCGHGVILGLN
jgi:hypothetical protein